MEQVLRPYILSLLNLAAVELSIDQGGFEVMELFSQMVSVPQFIASQPK